MEKSAGRHHPRLNIVETTVNEPARGDEDLRPHLEIALYPQRLDRTAPPPSLTPSQAVRYAEDPARVEEAARTAGSRQIVETVSLAALWSESGAATAAEEARAEPQAPQRTPEPGPQAPEPASWTPEPEPASWTPEPEPAPWAPEPEPASWTPEPEPASWTPEPEPASWTPEPEPEPAPAASSGRGTQPWYAAAAATGGTRRSPWWRRLLRRG
jgi:hypothetical protein